VPEKELQFQKRKVKFISKSMQNDRVNPEIKNPVIFLILKA